MWILVLDRLIVVVSLAWGAVVANCCVLLGGITNNFFHSRSFCAISGGVCPPLQGEVYAPITIMANMPINAKRLLKNATIMFMLLRFVGVIIFILVLVLHLFFGSRRFVRFRVVP